MGSGVSNLFSQNPMRKSFPSEEVPSFKIVIVGDSHAGKSSVFLRYTKEQFDYSYQPTVTVSIGNVTKKVQQPFETLVSITLWDLPGREEIDLRKSYYEDLDAGMVVVDMSDEGSIQMAGTWKQDIVNNCLYSSETGEKVIKDMKSQMQLPILLVGNKMDKVIVDEESGEQPRVLQLLEEVAVQHNFVGCVVVSACNSDGGVHAAFRSLVAYLLEKKMPEKQKKKVTDASNLKDIFSNPNRHSMFSKDLLTSEDHDYQPLLLCKLEEFDKIFRQCDKQVKSIEVCCVGFLFAVKNFKRSCCVSGVTDSYKASIEECVTSLRKTLRDNAEEEVLVGQEEAGYIQFKLNETTEEIPGPLKRVLEIYENEVCRATRRVLSQCPPLRVSLSDSLAILFDLEPTAETTAIQAGFNKKQGKLCVEHINTNIHRIKDTIGLADESMKVTDDQFKKIKTAMMW